MEYAPLESYISKYYFCLFTVNMYSQNLWPLSQISLKFVGALFTGIVGKSTKKPCLLCNYKTKHGDGKFQTLSLSDFLEVSIVK